MLFNPHMPISGCTTFLNFNSMILVMSTISVCQHMHKLTSFSGKSQNSISYIRPTFYNMTPF